MGNRTVRLQFWVEVVVFFWFVFCLFCLFVCLFSYDFTNDYRDSNFLVWSFGRLNCGMTSTATGIMSSTLQLKKHLSQYIYAHEAFDISDCSGI